MTTTNLNIRTDKKVKEQAEQIYSQLGLNMTTGTNLFLRASIRENGIPFDLKLNGLNEDIKLAIQEGRKIAKDESAASYDNMEDLKTALEK